MSAPESSLPAPVPVAAGPSPQQKRSATYYERNRDAVKEKALARYYKKIGKEMPKREPTIVIPAIPVLDAKELITRLLMLLPILKKEEKKEAKKEARAEARAEVAEANPPTLTIKGDHVVRFA
jgi:Lon protease-like protein